MSKTPREIAFDDEVVVAAKKTNRYFDRPIAKIADLVWQVRLVLPGGAQRSAATVLGYIDHNLNQHAAKMEAQLAGLIGAINALNKGEKFDETKLLKSIEQAAQRGVTNSIGSVTREEVTVVTMKEAEAPE